MRESEIPPAENGSEIKFASLRVDWIFKRSLVVLQVVKRAKIPTLSVGRHPYGSSWIVVDVVPYAVRQSVLSHCRLISFRAPQNQKVLLLQVRQKEGLLKNSEVSSKWIKVVNRSSTNRNQIKPESDRKRIKSEVKHSE